MTDHLPECFGREPERFGSSCICHRLRACEQRVLEDDVLAAAYHGEKGYAMGYAVALNAAEAAVEAIGRFDWIPPTYAKTKVVAAIRALKEKP